jgi:ubiquinone biosynthesis protein
VSILSFRRTIRSSQRLATILGVLARHGFGHMVIRLRLERFVPFHQKLARRSPPKPRGSEDLSGIATSLVQVLEELGPTFIKLGQSLASRPDLLPREFQAALRRLQDQVHPFPFEEVKEAIEHDLGAPLEKLFKEFDEKPFACGSIGQAHYAKTVEGDEVVIKVKRPGIERLIMQDVDLLRAMAQLIDKHMPEFRIYRPLVLVDEFARTLRNELDFLNEASVTSRFHDLFAENPNIESPQVFWDLTSHNVLTLERLHGVTISPDTDFAAAGLDRRALARNLLDVFFKQFFEIGIFHADPHPGNLLAQAPANWGIIDFGQTGRLDSDMRSRLAMCLTAASNREFDLLIEILEDIGALAEESDRSLLKNDFASLIDKYYGTPIKRINIATLFEEVTVLAREHQMILPRDFVLLGKAMAAIGGAALMLDPECAPIEVIKPMVNRLILDKFSPTRIGRNLAINAYHLGTFMQQAPQMLRRMMRNMSRGEFRLIFRHDGLEGFITELDRSSNRIAFSVITASIILGSALLMHARLGPNLYGTQLPVLGLIGFVLAAFFGVWLLISIFRSGRL